MALLEEPTQDIWSFGQRILGVFVRLYRALKHFIAVFLIAAFAFTLLPTSATQISLQESLAIGWLGDSVSAHVLRWLLSYLVPPGEKVYALGPFDVFNVLMMIGAFLGLMVALPVLAFDLYRYFGRAFYASERRLLRNLSLMGTSLFFFGVIFGLLVLLPPVFLFAYDLQVTIGAQSGVGLYDFFETVVMFSLTLGLVFQIPTVAYALAKLHILHAEAMRKYRFLAIGATGVMAFIVSPGTGGGIVEGVIFAILYSLFELSILIVSRVERKESPKKSMVESTDT